MRRVLIVVGSIVLSAAASCRPQTAQTPSELSEADRQSIQSVSDRFRAHALAKNADSLASLYTDDAVVMPPNHAPIVGRGAIREWQASSPTITAVTLDNEKVEGTGDLAYVRGRYVMAVAGAPTDSGKYLEIRRRQPDGSWKIAVDMFSSNLAAPPPAKP